MEFSDFESESNVTPNSVSDTVERILVVTNPCPANLSTLCVENLDKAVGNKKFIDQSNIDLKKGGCITECVVVVDEDFDPTPNPNLEYIDNCYNSCVADFEECIKKACKKICTIYDNGLTQNCNLNETCEDTNCVLKKCDMPCDEYYETCDAATNTCKLRDKKPVIDIITSCTPVDNCDAKYFLNTCYKCKNTYSFKINATSNNTSSQTETPQMPSGIPKCVQSNISNALMASVSKNSDDNDVFKVEKCVLGYVLDYNNNACNANVKNCKLYDKEGECIGCDTPYETGFVQLVWGVFEKGYCKTWIDISSEEQVSQKDIYQEHCKFYEYKYTTISVQSLKDGESKCYECIEGYYFNTSVNPHECKKGNASDCQTFDSTNAFGECSVCNPGYVLDNDTKGCEEIRNENKRIPGCSLYDANLNCLACENGYLFRIYGESSDQTGYCLFEFKDDTCTTMNAEVFKNTGAVECQKCTKVKGINYYARQLSTGINACVYIGRRGLCVKHDFLTTYPTNSKVNNSLLLPNTFQCLECESDYYLSNLICVRRQQTEIKNCIQYNTNSDTCKKYKAAVSAALSDSEFDNEIESIQNILLYPPDNVPSTEEVVNFGTWVMSCEIYKNETTCERCFAHKYVNEFGFEYNTKCINTNVQIKSCISYSDADTCIQCFPGYILMNNKCLLITVENCKTYIDENNCGSCPDMQPYLDVDGNCRVDPRNIFCLIYTISNETISTQNSKVFECDTCLEGFYPDDSSICTVVENEVPNCKYYSSDGLCKECEELFYLNYDGKRCYINPPFDPFCKSFTYLTECSICQKQHYVGEDGKCKPCNSESLPQNCEYCDPKDHSVCLMCSFGYQNTVDGCVLTEGSTVVEFIQPYSYFLNQVKTSTPQTTQAKLLVNAK